MDKIEVFTENLKTTLIILIVFCIGFVTGAIVYEQENREIENKQVVVQNEL